MEVLNNPNLEVAQPLLLNDTVLFFNQRLRTIGPNDNSWEVKRWQKKGDDWITKNNPSSFTNELPGHRNVGFVNEKNFYVLYEKKANKKKLYKISWQSAGEFKKKEVKISKLKKANIHSVYVHPSDTIMILSLEYRQKSTSTKEDLFVSKKNKDGKWSEPTHLGITINTDASEITPFLSQNGQRLFFSSKDNNNFGGYDIFFSDRLYESWNLWTMPRNLGKHINSPLDETFFSSSEYSAVFLSNKEGADNIYSTHLVSDAFVPSNIYKYKNIIENNNYHLAENLYHEQIAEEKHTSDLITTGNDSVKVQYLLHFDKSLFKIRPEYKRELEDLVTKMKENDNHWLKIEGHTDIEGSISSNLKLSEKRANAVKQFFLEKNIAENRIRTVGKGQSELIKRERDEVAQAFNRRVEITVFEINKDNIIGIDR